ncbi:MAG: hypothetical protein WCL44_07415 [bacterium]
MNSRWTVVLAIGVAVVQLVAPGACQAFDDDFDRESMEEPAGATCSLLAGPDAGVYGLSFGSGVWLKGLPVYGDLWMSLFQNDTEDSFYSGIGLTVRLMPRWKLAPFLGGGGSFNYDWASGYSTNGTSDIPAEAVAEAARRGGGSYWGGHAECGLRLMLDSRPGLIEVFGRHTWSSSGAYADHWLIGLSTGVGW